MTKKDLIILKNLLRKSIALHDRWIHRAADPGYTQAVIQLKTVGYALTRALAASESIGNAQLTIPALDHEHVES